MLQNSTTKSHLAGAVDMSFKLLHMKPLTQPIIPHSDRATCMNQVATRLQISIDLIITTRLTVAAEARAHVGELPTI